MNNKEIAVLCFVSSQILGAGAPVWSARIDLCGDDDECVCIQWGKKKREAVEVRCPRMRGWTDDRAGWTGRRGSLIDLNGSEYGSGLAQTPRTPYSGRVLTGELKQAVEDARTIALRMLTEERTCNALFQDNPLALDGAFLVSLYTVYLDGEGVLGPGGVVPCDWGYVATWTTCCSHEPYVYVCKKSFLKLPLPERAFRIIHEVLHVAGQAEDASTTTGLGDPPTGVQINEVVRGACG